VSQQNISIGLADDLRRLKISTVDQEQPKWLHRRRSTSVDEFDHGTVGGSIVYCQFHLFVARRSRFLRVIDDTLNGHLQAAIDAFLDLA
jgi:hypothetical protein